MNPPRWTAVAIGLWLAAPAAADRLITIPVARKIPVGSAKLQHLFDGVEKDRSQTVLGLGIHEFVDVEIARENFARGEKVSLDLAYSLNDPLLHYGPGFAIGVRDVFDQTAEGRYGYLVFTYEEGLSGVLNQETPAEVTIGAKYGDRNGFRIFLGAKFPHSRQLSLVAESELGSMTAGLEITPTPNLQVRWLHRQQQSFWTIGWQMKF